MSLDAKKKRTLTVGVIALVAVAGIVWALTSNGDSATARVVDRRGADDSTDQEDLESADTVAVRSSPQSGSGSSRLEGTTDAEADRDDKLAGGVDKKTKRTKKTRRRRTQKRQDDEEEAASAANKKVIPPYGK